MVIQYVTGNPGKFATAQRVLSDWTLVQRNLDMHEIQGEPKQILLVKARKALIRLREPLLIEDVSMECSCLEGLPGPYIKDFMIRLGEAGFAGLIHQYSDHSVNYICRVAYIAPGRSPTLFEGRIEGQIVMPRGECRHGDYGFDRILQPKGYELTLGEMTEDEVAAVSARARALEKVAEFLHVKG